MPVTKLILAILAGGPVLGILAGVAVDPTMKPAPEPWWRGKLEKPYVPVEPYRMVEAGPQDLSPLRWPAGYMPDRRAPQPQPEPLAEPPAEPIPAAEPLPEPIVVPETTAAPAEPEPVTAPGEAPLDLSLPAEIATTS